MILLVHMLFGAAIGSLFKNPFLGILAALLSHYFLDLFPHIEYLESTEQSIKSRKTNEIIKVAIDLVLGLALVGIFSDPPTKEALLLYIYAFVAIIPDGLTVVTHLFPNQWLVKHHALHGGPIHYLTKQKKFPIFWKIATQALAILVSIYILII